jgi:superfamily II DNA or RNA helicase
VSIDQAEMQLALEKYFNFSLQTLFRSYNLVEHNKVNQSFVKGSLNAPFTLSGIVSDNNTTYSCKIQSKSPDVEIITQCNCKKHSTAQACEHVLSLFYDFYQQQVLQGSLLQNETTIAGQDIESAQSPRYGIVIRAPQDLICRKRASSFHEITFRLNNGTEATLSDFSIKPYLGEILLEFNPAVDESGRAILKNFHPLYYLKATLRTEDTHYKHINFLSHDLILDWDNGHVFSVPEQWASFLRMHAQANLLQSLDEHLTLLANYAPTTIFIIGDKSFDLKNFIEPKLNVNITEGKLRHTYFISLNASVESNTVATPLLLSLFAEKNNTFTYPGHLFNSQSYTEILLKYKFSLDELEDALTPENRLIEEQKQFYNTWLDDTDAAIYKLIHESKERFRLELWTEIWTNKDYIYTCDFSNGVVHRWSTKYLIFVLAKFFSFWGAHTFKKSEWIYSQSHLVFEITHHNLFRNIGDVYKDFFALNVNLYWQHKPLYQWKTNSKIQRVHHDLDWFNLKVDINPEDFRILQQIQNNQTVQWLDGKMILLSDEQKIFSQLIKRYLPSQIEIGEDHQVTIKLQRSRIFELFHLKKIGFDHLLTAEEENLCNSLMNLQGIPQYEIESRYVDVLRSYQIDGYRWLRFLYEHQLGGCLADDMGLGKTIQTISLIQTMQKQLKKVLIVCPVSILWNWQEELTKFSDLKVKLYYADQRMIDDNDQIILTSYGLLKRDFEQTFKSLNLDILILDEVQQLKNHHSLGSQIAKKLNARVRFVLTGTPVENDITEFYNILDLSVPGIWGEQKWQRKGVEEAKSVAKIISKPFVLRRTKAQVLKELPDKTEQIVYLAFSPDEEKNYHYNLLQIQQAITEVSQKQMVGQVLKNLLQLRQMCLWQAINHIEHSTKMNYLIENVTQLLLENHSIIIFSQFTSYLDRIQKRMLELKVGISRIDGSQSLKNRQEHVQLFQDGTNPIFLISLRAGGFGLNLTRASYLFLMDPWWNPAVENQAIDRAHRIGQNKHLTVYRPVIKNTVEEKVLKLQQDKKKLFDDLVNSDGEDHFSGKLNMDDFKFLLS